MFKRTGLDFVVGSGPAGVACAHALAQKDRKVVVLDAGIVLEADRRAVRLKLGATAPSGWPRDDLAFLRGAAPKHPGAKLAYGSDFVYRAATGATKVVSTGADARASYAVGGFSNIWGSAVLSYRQQDLDGWPVTAAELASSYAAVLKWMPVASQRDDLEQFFPSFLDEYVALPQSRQAQRLLRTLTRNRATLKASGVFFSPSRLAVDARGTRSIMGCQTCGHCLYGCPYDLIYSTNGTLSDMIAAGRTEHRPGVMVQRVEETEQGVRVHGLTPDGGACVFEGDRVFLGAGAINTTAILLRSLGWYGRTLQMKDSQFFQLPALHVHYTPGVEAERLHTLCQVFIDIFDERLSPYTIHLQVYTYNNIFREELAARLGPLATLFPKTLLLGRLLLLQGLLHSSHSGRIDVTLRREGDEEFIELVGTGNPVSNHCVQGIAAKLLKLARSTGLIPMTPMLNLARPGGGFHFGGTFPMRRVPSLDQSDWLGRPAGLKRVYVIDSTVFPSIPATTITFTVMANAHRIGMSAEDGQ